MPTHTPTKLPGIPHTHSGKIREIYQLDPQHLLIITTDRISAYDTILPNTIPQKGEILTQLSDFWFQQTQHITPNHRTGIPPTQWPKQLQTHHTHLQTRAVIVHKTQPIPIECIIRGYLTGTAWKEYQTTQTINQTPYPTGLQHADPLPQPIYTPTTKNQHRHDQPITPQQTTHLIGKKLAQQIQQTSLQLYQHAQQHAQKHGLIIADTKFEFGLQNNKLLLIDEALTPDSSRIWTTQPHPPGTPPQNYDKQTIRDYLQTTHWNKTNPPPTIPNHIIQKTRTQYLHAHKTLTQQPLKTNHPQ